MISIVIATYNRGEKLVRTLRSLAAQTLPPDEWEAVVVDNNSSDDTAAHFADFARANPRLALRMVAEPRQGLSHARNRGIAASRGDVIAIIDDDEEVNPEFAAAYEAFFRQHSDVLAGGGKVIPRYETGCPAWMSPYTERPIAGTIDRGNVRKPFGRGYPAGGNMAARRAAFETYGVFDTSLGRTGNTPLGGEEKEWFSRLTAAGEQVWYIPEAVIYHIIPPEKLTSDYFRRLARGCGVSERIRTRSLSRASYVRALAVEILVKWPATLALAAWYLATLHPLKAHYLLTLRRGITGGMVRG